MNAIQHQCSAAVAPEAHRDKIFLLMWEQQCVKDDFARRLLEYANGDDFRVVNACTEGKARHKLWQLVEETINARLNRPSDLSIPHPANWTSDYVANGSCIDRRTPSGRPSDGQLRAQ
jgi:hypothetical protein